MKDTIICWLLFISAIIFPLALSGCGEKYNDFCDDKHVITEILARDQFVLDEIYIIYLKDSRFDDKDFQDFIGDTISCIKEYPENNWASMNKEIKVRFYNTGFIGAQIIGEQPLPPKPRKGKSRR